MTEQELLDLDGALQTVQAAVAPFALGGTLGGDVDAIRATADAGRKTIAASLRDLRGA